jgi:preprotein translocase subunit YajC
MNYRLAGILNAAFIFLSAFSAAAQAKQPSPGAAFTTSILPMMLIMFVIIYFLMIRPEQKKQKDRQSMIAAVKKGDKVLTIGGVYGIVGNVKDNSVMVKIADNTVVEFTKASISSVVSKGAGDGTEKTEKETEKNK